VRWPPGVSSCPCGRCWVQGNPLSEPPKDLRLRPIFDGLRNVGCRGDERPAPEGDWRGESSSAPNRRPTSATSPLLDQLSIDYPRLPPAVILSCWMTRPARAREAQPVARWRKHHRELSSDDHRSSGHSPPVNLSELFPARISREKTLGQSDTEAQSSGMRSPTRIPHLEKTALGSPLCAARVRARWTSQLIPSGASGTRGMIAFRG